MQESVIRVYVFIICTTMALTLSPVEGQNNYFSIPPENIKEVWNKHTDNLTPVYWNNMSKVVIYFGENLCPFPPGGSNAKTWEFSCPGNALWLFNFTANVWSYMTQTYGQFGTDPYLFLVIHQNAIKPPYFRYSLEKKDRINRNILDISSSNPTAWLTSLTRNDEMDLIVNRLAYFVDRSSKQRLGSPSFNFFGRMKRQNVWGDIFTYDVYSSLKMTEHAKRYNESKFNTSENYPQQHTFWYRNWFLPIYKRGGNKVLNGYFQLLSKNLPTKDGVNYNYTLNMGEFVHFWSGAAGLDLRYLANNSFTWNMNYNKMFIEARQKFGNVSLYKIWFSDRMELQKLKSTSPHSSTQDQSMELGSTEVITGLVVVGAIILSCFLILIVYVVLFKQKIQNLKSDIRALTEKEVKDFFEGDKSGTEEAQTQVLSLPFIKDFEIERNRLIIAPNRIIGTGQFGCVIHGFIQHAETRELLPVAVKTVKADVEVLHFKAMLSEAKIMTYLGRHDNIVKLMGTCTANIKNREIFIALELCPLGDLQTFLKKYKENYVNLFSISEESASCRQSLNVIGQNYTVLEPHLNRISTLDLLKWSQEITSAMTYLTEKKVIHGDLASRNVLLTANRVAQVSDFGLSRQLINYDEYTKTTQAPLPWRWMAVESLREKQFSIASDVWAFGVTMWELFSLAETPYAGWTWDFAFMDKLDRGDRLLLPRFANQQVFEVMEGCWAFEAADRPSFREINNILGVITSDLLIQTRNEQANDEVVDDGKDCCIGVHCIELQCKNLVYKNMQGLTALKI